MRRGARAAIIAIGTITPAVVVWVGIALANPPHHDLSDAGTGLIQLFFSALAAVLGLTLSVIATRRR